MMSIRKFARQLGAITALWLLLAWTAAGAPALPQRDLSVELRQLDEASALNSQHDQGTVAAGKHFSAGAAATSDWEPQMVQVRNGEKASLRLHSAIPMQWVQSAFVRVDNTVQAPQNSQSGTAGVQNALTWFDAGQSMSVRPRWSGGKTAVVELEVQAAGFDAAANLPAQSRSTVSTTVTAPLARWVTIAASGQIPQESSYSSELAQHPRRVLQIRVMVP